MTVHDQMLNVSNAKYANQYHICPANFIDPAQIISTDTKNAIRAFQKNIIIQTAGNRYCLIKS